MNTRSSPELNLTVSLVSSCVVSGGWLRRFAAERRRVREPERSREAAQLRLLSRPVFVRLTFVALP